MHKENSNNITIMKTYFGFFLNGFLLLSIGAIMPDLIKNLSLSFSTAGFLLSMYSFGNLIAYFVFPIIAEKVTSKKAIRLFLILVPLAFLTMYFFKNDIKNVLWLIYLIIGLGMGSVPIVSSNIINDLSKDEVVGMNILHTTFAIGALSAPFSIVLLKNSGLNFDQVILFLAVTMGFMWLLFSSINFDYITLKEDDIRGDSKNLDLYFISIAIVLFFYLGIENTINGWLMTYLQNLNVLSETFSASMVSLTWVMIMVGRVFTIFASKKVKGPKLVIIYSLGVAAMILSLIFTRKPAFIAFTILALGFFLAGIFPTSVSNAAAYTRNNTKRLSILFISSSIGGMVTPQIVGWVGDRTSILFAINVLLVNVVAMVIFASITFRLYNKSK